MTVPAVGVVPDGPVPGPACFLTGTAVVAAVVGALGSTGLMAFVIMTTTSAFDIQSRLAAAGMAGVVGLLAVFGFGVGLDCRALQARGLSVARFAPAVWALLVPALLLVMLPVYLYLRAASSSAAAPGEAGRWSVAKAAMVGVAVMVAAVLPAAIAPAFLPLFGVQSFQADDSTDAEASQWLEGEGVASTFVDCDRSRLLLVGDTFTCTAYGHGLPGPITLDGRVEDSSGTLTWARR